MKAKNPSGKCGESRKNTEAVELSDEMLEAVSGGMSQAEQAAQSEWLKKQLTEKFGEDTISKWLELYGD